MKAIRIPFATFSLIGIQVVAFFWQMGMNHMGLGYHVYYDYTFEWNRFLNQPWDQWPTLISCMLFHGGWSHLIGNMVFLAVFGSALEMSTGLFYFLGVYFLSGIVGSLLHAYFSPLGGLIGSSGAISGVMGALFVLHPMRMPEGIFRRYFPWISQIPVFVYLGLWFVWQLWMGHRVLIPRELNQMTFHVAYLAHVGGFATGALLIVPMVLKKASLRRRPSAD